MSGLGGGRCAKCGKIQERSNSTEGDKPTYSKCVKCGLVYCSECWEPDFVEICPRCMSKCR